MRTGLSSFTGASPAALRPLLGRTDALGSVRRGGARSGIYAYSMKLATTLALLALIGSSACSKSASVEVASEPDATPAPVEAKLVEDPSDVHLVGDHLEIDKKIMFAHDSDEILDESNEILDHISVALHNHGEFTKLHVIGHTDSTGDDAHNQDLSERRAAAVVAALRERGQTQTLDARGAGENEPTCTEDTDECHEQNRRVEFVVEQ